MEENTFKFYSTRTHTCTHTRFFSNVKKKLKYNKYTAYSKTKSCKIK